MAANTADLLQLADALATWKQEISGAADGPWQYLTCREAEAMAELMRALGDERCADVILEKHATGDDDPEDMHYTEEGSND